MKKKLLSVLLGLTMVSSLFVGCASKEKPSGTTPTDAATEAPQDATDAPTDDATEEPKADAPAEITYWSMWQSTEPQAAVIQEAAAAYEAKTGTKVNIEWKGRDIKTIIVSALESGESIDFFDDDYQRVGSTYKDLVLPLDDMAAAAGYETKGMPVLINAIKNFSGGPLVAIGYQPYTSGIFYDKAAFTKAGIAAEPKTWAEFLDVCQKLKDAGIEPIALDDAYARLTLGFQLARNIGQDGVKKVVKEGNWAEEPGVLKAVKEIQELVDKGYFSKSAPAVYPKGENEIGFGTTAMVLNASWVPNEIQNNTESTIDWGCFSYPAVENGVDGTEAAMIGAQALAINKNSKNAQAAFDFIMLITTGEYDKKMADATNGLPSDQTITEWPALVQCTQESFLALTKQYDWNCGMDENADMQTVISENIMKVYEGKSTAEKFVEAMEAASK